MPSCYNVNSQSLGSLEFLPQRNLIAGEVGSYVIRYTVGQHGIDDGGTLKLVQRGSSDWGIPQQSNPQSLNYTSIQYQGAAILKAYFDPKGFVRPWFWCLTIDVSHESIKPGEIVEIVLGDTTHGSAGMRCQTFVETCHEINLAVDPTNSAQPKLFSDSLEVSIIPAAPFRMVAVIPTTGQVDEKFSVRAKLEDKWGNPTEIMQTANLEWVTSNDSLFVPDFNFHLDVTSNNPCKGYFTVTDSINNFKVNTNQITIQKKSKYQGYWGDLHAQSGFTVGTGDEDEYYLFARDKAFLDFCSHQANDFQITDTYWQHLNTISKAYNEEGKFIVFPGYEWSGNSSLGGDRNIFFIEEGMPIFRSSTWLVKDEVCNSLAVNAHELFKNISEDIPKDKVLLAAHVGGRYAVMDDALDKEMIALLEIVSCWGIFEWFVKEALAQGKRIGIMANSDGHKGRPGAEYPGDGEFGIQGGLTCVLSEHLSRNSIFKALQSRRCYGTTGVRIGIDCTLCSLPIGSDVIVTNAEDLTVRGTVLGTAPLEYLKLINGRTGESIIEYAPEFNRTPTQYIKLMWGGSYCKGRARRINWSGRILAKNCFIETCSMVAFDSPADFAKFDSSTNSIAIYSRTTGDMDGVVLKISGEVENSAVVFETHDSSFKFKLSDVPGAGEEIIISAGGLDAKVVLQRYPETLKTYTLPINFNISPQTEEIPWYLKVVQSDGHMAWASPFFVRLAP
jgi:hypothetical protein